VLLRLLLSLLVEISVSQCAVAVGRVMFTDSFLVVVVVASLLCSLTVRGLQPLAVALLTDSHSAAPLLRTGSAPVRPLQSCDDDT